MKKHLLTASLTLTLLLSGQAAAFSDVPDGAWYAADAALCQSVGLMQGTGEDTFSPEGTVTLAEVMTVVARLHELSQGGDGVLPQAPAAWGIGSLTTLEGSTLLTFSAQDLVSGRLSYHYDNEQPRRLHLQLSVNAAQLRALTPAGGGSSGAALVLNGTHVLTGFLSPVGNGVRRVEFVSAAGADHELCNRELSSFLAAPVGDVWYRDALWYVQEHGIMEDQPMAQFFEDPATRIDLAEWLCKVLPPEDLPAIGQAASVPGIQDLDVLRLYQAGILTGVDEAGTFAGDRTLTRAELSAVLARVVDPSRRVMPG